MSKDQTSGSEALVALAIALAAIPLTGWVISVMWGWFVAPLGVPQIGTAHAMGISTLAGMFRGREPSSEDEMWQAVAKAVLVPLLMLLVGSACHWAMR